MTTPSLGFSFYDQTSYHIAEVRVAVVRDVAAQLATDKADKPELAVEFFRNVVMKAEWFDADKECVVVLLLDRKNQIKGWNLMTLGTQTASLMSPKEVLRLAIVGNAAGFIVMHNHPSGDPAPSAADQHVTRMLREAAKVVDVCFLDHVIVGTREQDPNARGFFSFREAGII